MAQCITPFTRKDQMTNQTQKLPCGKCPACTARRVSGWSFRLMQEDKHSITSQFITLTYDTKQVPISKNGFMSLNPRDLQLFFKRLRKRHKAGTVIKYFAVGEYGGRTSRPHYHIILFNADITLIQESWNLGSVHYGTVSGASVGYTLKYISKPGKIPLHKNDDRHKEFARMSKRLGEQYLTQAMRRWHKRDLDNRVYLTIEDGKKVSMPRYYKDKLYTDQERKRIAFLGKIRAEADQVELTDQEKRDLVQQHLASFARMKAKSNQLSNNKI